MGLPIPKTLDEIVTRNRNKVAIGLATDADIAALAEEIPDGRIRDTINDWRIIAIRIVGGDASLRLLGQNGRGESWITSDIRGINIDRGLVRTKNSRYALGTRGEGEPPQDQILHVCHACHSWGFGLAIGALDVFY